MSSAHCCCRDKWPGQNHTLRRSRCTEEHPNFWSRWEGQLTCRTLWTSRGLGKGISLGGRGAGALPQGGPPGVQTQGQGLLSSGSGWEWGGREKGVWQDSGKYPGHRADIYYQSWTSSRCGEGRSQPWDPQSGLVFTLWMSMKLGTRGPQSLGSMMGLGAGTTDFLKAWDDRYWFIPYAGVWLKGQEHQHPSLR